MVKHREILRLASIGVSQESIAFSCGCCQSTVPDVLRAARVRGVAWPLPEEMDDAVIRAVIYPKKRRKAEDKAPIDHEHIASELDRRGMTMSLLWNERCDDSVARGMEPYMYSAFCKEHRKWAQSHDVRMRTAHRPAEEIQVDWAGDTGVVVDPDTGEALKAYVFAACLPYSDCLFANGFYKTDEEYRIAAHVRMFAAFGGSTPILVPRQLQDSRHEACEGRAHPQRAAQADEPALRLHHRAGQGPQAQSTSIFWPGFRSMCITTFFLAAHAA